MILENIDKVLIEYMRDGSVCLQIWMRSSFNPLVVHVLCVRELERKKKEQEEKKHEEEMERLREEELKKKSKMGGKKDTKEVSRKKNLLEGKQVCICIPFQHLSMNKMIY